METMVYFLLNQMTCRSVEPGHGTMTMGNKNSKYMC